MYKLLKTLSKIFCAMPSLAKIVCGVLAEIAWLVMPERRKQIAVNNISACLKVDASEAAEIARQSVKNLGKNLAEFMLIPALSTVEVTGKENLRGSGIFISAHLGNWELMGGALARAGVKLVGVYKKQGGGADKFIMEMRQATGVEIAYKTEVREMYRLLGAGKSLGLVMDQDCGRRDAVLVKFFGRATAFATGAASLSRFTGKPIYPAFLRGGKLEVLPALYCEKTSDKRADIFRTTQALATIIEQNILLQPEAWFWLHDRWKSIRTDYTPTEIAEFEKELGI